MLPRTQKNKQIIMKNESDSDEQIIINCNQLAKNKKKVEARPTTGVDKKKPKYLPQTKYEEYEEDVLFTKKKSQVTKNNRKGVLGNQQIHNENNNVKSVNHFGENQQKINRNKSVFGRDLKNDLGKSVKNNYQVPKKVTGGTQPVVSDRKSFLNNNSLLEKKGHLKLKD